MRALEGQQQCKDCIWGSVLAGPLATCTTWEFQQSREQGSLFTHTHHLLSHAQTTSPKSTLSFTQPQQLSCFTKVNTQGQYGILHLEHQGRVEVRCFSQPCSCTNSPLDSPSSEKLSQLAKGMAPRLRAVLPPVPPPVHGRGKEWHLPVGNLREQKL